MVLRRLSVIPRAPPPPWGLTTAPARNAILLRIGIVIYGSPSWGPCTSPFGSTSMPTQRATTLMNAQMLGRPDSRHMVRSADPHAQRWLRPTSRSVVKRLQLRPAISLRPFVLLAARDLMRICCSSTVSINV